MNAAKKKAAEQMADVDVVIEVVDARLPAASCNPLVEELRKFRQRPCLKILNKIDLADPEATAAWIRHFEQDPTVTAYAMTTKKPSDVAKVIEKARKLAPHRNEPIKPLRMMIMGIPNVGKSTLMNALLKRRVAKVGDEPAVTKTQQKIYLDISTAIIDTPGLLWPKIEMPSDGLALAASHAIGANALIEEEVAEWLAELLLARYPDLLAARYKLKPEGMDGVGVVERVAQLRNYRQRGGDWDYEKASHMLLQDYRSGALGRISLETPETRDAALTVFREAERIKAEAAAAKAAEKEAERMKGKRGT
jgi:ribosome biogenesis GTPase A